MQFLAATTDNAADNGTMLAQLSRQHRQFGVVYNHQDVWSRCMGHVLNLVAQAILKGVGALPPSDEEQDRVETEEDLDLEPEDDTNFDDNEGEIVGSSGPASYSSSMPAPATSLSFLPSSAQPLTYLPPPALSASVSPLTYVPAPALPAPTVSLSLPSPPGSTHAAEQEPKKKKPPTATQVALNKVCFVADVNGLADNPLFTSVVQ